MAPDPAPGPEHGLSFGFFEGGLFGVFFLEEEVFVCLFVLSFFISVSLFQIFP